MFLCIVCVPWARAFRRAENLVWAIKSGILFSHCFLFEKCPSIPIEMIHPRAPSSRIVERAPFSHCVYVCCTSRVQILANLFKIHNRARESTGGQFWHYTPRFLLRLINLCLIFGLFPCNRRARLFFAQNICAAALCNNPRVCIVARYGSIMLQIMAAQKRVKNAHNEERPLSCYIPGAARIKGK